VERPDVTDLEGAGQYGAVGVTPQQDEIALDRRDLEAATPPAVEASAHLYGRPRTKASCYMRFEGHPGGGTSTSGGWRGFNRPLIAIC
jgi:hypothetical protein